MNPAPPVTTIKFFITLILLNKIYKYFVLKILSLILDFQPYLFAKEISMTFLGTPLGFDLSYIDFDFFIS